MILKMYTIYDRKSELHHPPVYYHNTGHAMRGMMMIFADENMVFHKYPADFQVFEIGSFDDADASLKQIKPHLICSGTELVKHDVPGA